ncbi:MAG: signal recognition particle-docking protein FtsY [Euryarchaeota archaeon]|jgi:fused signal recognition particle receptor|nr:signal recognition particle-docking protein FtsY [Euryarchaeota archaeon]|tara:strand:+ start:1339 stop:2586 length:1248 start_codon:yes stop_codon:yes gene_type:complete
MGLFDRFRKKVNQADEGNGFMAEEGSEIAEKAIADREEALRSMNQEDATPDEPTGEYSEWDEFDDDFTDPFSAPTNSKERKRAAREQANKKSKQPVSPPIRDPMDSTTGRKLAESDMTFEIDLSEYHTNIGGMVISGGALLDEILEELEDELLSSDMGHDAASELITNLKTHLIGSRVSRKAPLSEVVERGLRGALLSLLKSGYWDFDRTISDFVTEGTPVVIMMVGVNGTGKTTTSAKIAKRLTDQGYGVVLAAADTFRAGAIDQLSAHADRLGIRCIKSQRGGDSAAVARDAIESARAKDDDVVIIDTSGRMQNKSNLMEELQKVHRVTQPHLVLFVADALAGNDAVTQAIEFQRRLTFDGAALCKLDTDARGGAALSISHATGRPIILAGTGQGYDDLEPFDPNWLVDQLLS